MKTIAVYNMKGGVGKTTASVNLAYLAAKDGYKTLLCDLDPQGSASYYFRVTSPKKLSAKHLVKGDKVFLHSVRATNYEGLDILPADFSFRKLPTELNERKRSKKRLREALGPFEDEYDLVFIDAPAGLNLEGENIFLASDMILVPMIPSTLSVQTLELMYRFFKKRELEIVKLKLFFSLVDRRKKMHTQTMEEIMERESNVFSSWLPYSSTIEKMGLTREPVPVHSRKSKAVQALHSLWDECKRQPQLNLSKIGTKPTFDSAGPGEKEKKGPAHLIS